MNLTEKTFRSFVRATTLFRSVMTAHFSRFGITGAQWAVLRALQRAEESGLKGLRPSELGRRLLVRRPSVTSVVERLVGQKLVTCRKETDDQRSKRVALTMPGRRLMARVLDKHPRQMRRMLEPLNAAEQRRLHALTEQLAAHYEGMEDERFQPEEIGDLNP